MDNTYLVSYKYENFIRRVFNCDVNKHGASLNYMQNVIFLEQGKNYSRHLGSLDKQVTKVKMYIEKALLHLIDKTKSKENKEYFKRLLEELTYSNSSLGMMNVVTLAFEKLLDSE